MPRFLQTPGLNHQCRPKCTRGFYCEASAYLFQNDRLTASMLHLVTFTPPPHSCPCVFGSHTPSLSLLHPFCFWPSGVSVTPYMLRQLHSSPRYAQVCGHRLKGCVQWYGRWCKNTPASNCNARKGMPESCIYSSVTEKVIIKCPTELLTGFPIFPSCSPDCS